jgi:hypothetical protein
LGFEACRSAKVATATRSVWTAPASRTRGLELKDAHIKQAVEHAANQGIEWVVLTNAVQWRRQEGRMFDRANLALSPTTAPLLRSVTAV